LRSSVGFLQSKLGNDSAQCYSGSILGGASALFNRAEFRGDNMGDTIYRR